MRLNIILLCLLAASARRPLLLGSQREVRNLWILKDDKVWVRFLKIGRKAEDTAIDHLGSSRPHSIGSK